MAAIDVVEKIHVLFDHLCESAAWCRRALAAVFLKRRGDAEIGLVADGLNVENRASAVGVGIFHGFFDRIVLRCRGRRAWDRPENVKNGVAGLYRPA